MTKFEVGDVVDIMIGSGKSHQDRTEGEVVRVWEDNEGRALLTVGGYWGYADNAVLVRPKAFKPGDRVRHSELGDTEGTVKEHKPYPTMGGEVLVLWDGKDYVLGAFHECLTLLSRPEPAEEPLADWERELLADDKPAERPLVGPAPEPPVFESPFGDDGPNVIDNRGVVVLAVLDSRQGYSTRNAFAVFVANALNAAVKESK